MMNHLYIFFKSSNLLVLLLLLTTADKLHSQCKVADAGPDLLNNDVTSIKINASLPEGYHCSWSLVYDEINEELAFGVTPDKIYIPICTNNNAIFTGKPGESYQLIMSYDSSGACNSKDTIQISFSKGAIPVAIAGNDILDTSSLYINLYANIPAYQTYGKWSVIEGQDARIFDRFSPYSQFKGKAGEDYKLLWEVHNGTTLTNDTMLISFNSDAKLESIPNLSYEYISPSSENLWPNEKIQLKFDYEYMPYEDFTFTSLDTNIAKILNDFQVLLKSAGDVQLILTSVDNPVLADTISITVQSVEAHGGSDITNSTSNLVTLNGFKPNTYNALWSILEGNDGELLNSESQWAKLIGKAGESYKLLFTISGNGNLATDTVNVSFDGAVKNRIAQLYIHPENTGNDTTIQLSSSFLPINAVDTITTWSVNDTNIAKITEKGLLTFKADAGGMIGVTLANDSSGVSETKWYDSPFPYALKDEDICNEMIDKLYHRVIDYNSFSITTMGFESDLAIPSLHAWNSANKEIRGAYNEFYNAIQSNISSKSIQDVNYVSPSGIWNDSWRGILEANLILSKVDELSLESAEKKQLKGQALFFRGFFYWELTRHFGGFPYIDTVITPESDLNFKERPTAQQTLVKAAEDLEMAAQLLPEEWTDETNAIMELHRATKGAALSIASKAYLFAASPMYNKYATTSNAYYNTYLQKSATLAWDVIQLGKYSLIPISEYKNNFSRNDALSTYTDEVIFKPIDNGSGYGMISGRLGRIFLYRNSLWAGNSVITTPSQNLVDMFETATGYPIDHVSSAYDPSAPWDDRDPRFYESVYKDGDTIGSPSHTILEFYAGGNSDYFISQKVAPYLTAKYIPRGINQIDRNQANFVYCTPHIRFAEIYLIYAEAMNEIYGPDTDLSGNAFTARDAINTVRSRANMPAPDYIMTQVDFRNLIRNERTVELNFEGHRWHDLRRWYVAHNDAFKTIYNISFDKGQVNFSTFEAKKRVFTEKHYWLPVPEGDDKLYNGFIQNPGW